VVALNRRATFDYEIQERFVAGLQLTGTEVKSLRLGNANINDAYGIVEDGEVYVSNMSIAEYENKGYETHKPIHNRKLLLKKKEIADIIKALSRKGSTLVAIKLFFDKKGLAKIEMGLGFGKKLYDKRESIKERDWKIDKQRIIINRNS
jgi:SsrA-binding protein